ncbi:MAG: hypothetical protein SF172_12065 [Burkholderiales bacterium]|nr:hypothetical protein [Burkholderiales bacterium]
MNHKELSRTIIKIAGILMVIYYASRIPQWLAVIVDSSSDVSLLMVMATVVIPILLGVALYMFPGSIANRVIDGTDDTATINGAARLEEVCLRLLGGYFVLDTLPTIFFYAASMGLGRYLHDGISAASESAFLSRNVAGLISEFIQLGLALLLILKASDLAGFFRRIRNNPVDTSSDR